ncbi:hypothetical protein [Nakamurella endophytica]|uniref:Heavy metal transporter n=1 Tax=Nakamurella endophytica TaxID=1748367 RepID=A0A917WB86_9ACTN|nr:hypothetical protein [Nakamurella endophytica]GGL86383.1 hypothetical protein GCM10011594_02510 [Nakamurella endophytica]
MRRPTVWRVAVPVLVLVVVLVAVVVLVRGASSAPPGATAECTVPAVTGPPVTVVVEGPQSTGAGAAGTAEVNASPTAATSVVGAPDVELSAVALQNAATINAVGIAEGVPDRGRVIAVATAWQESRLRNLSGGDRDSIGLFQQRPSQGWGTAAQVADPVHASRSFYSALAEVSGWQRMSLTAAAQAVQYSAYPDAYAQWEPDATTLVRALSGAAPMALRCRTGAQPPTATTPVRTPVDGTAPATPELRTLIAAAAAELGGVQVVSVGTDRTSAVLGTAGRADAGVRARRLAAWLVAHATGAGVTRVTAGSQQWSPDGWSVSTAVAAPGRVAVAVG